jgi:undecaprenyl-diphosphatase
MTRMSTTTRPARTGARGKGATALVLVVAWLVLCAVVVGVGWLLTHPLTGTVGRMDNDLARWFARQRTSTLDVVADIGTLVGETITGLVVLTLVAAGFSRWQRSWRPAVFVAVTYAGLGGIYVVATHLDPRQRPPVKILDTGLVPTHSFPSGHVGTATAVAGCIAVLTWTYARTRQRWLPLLALLPAWTMLARMYQGAHHLTDVLAGLLTALVWLAVTARLVLPPRENASGHRPRRRGSTA